MHDKGKRRASTVARVVLLVLLVAVLPTGAAAEPVQLLSGLNVVALHRVPTGYSAGDLLNLLHARFIVRSVPNAALKGPWEAFLPVLTGSGGFEIQPDRGYIVSLSYPVVFNPEALTVSFPSNEPPFADAGSAQVFLVQRPVRLSALGSHDSDGPAPLTYTWSRSGGTGPAVVLSDVGAATPSFTTTNVGTYVFTVMVSDGAASSTASVTVTATNAVPVADAGQDQSVGVRGLVQLTGARSTDVDGPGPLTYSWRRTAGNGPGVDLANPSTASPTFTAASPGTYLFTVAVSDGLATSEDTVVIAASNERPVADAGTPRTVTAGTTVHLSASGSHDADGPDPLTFSWQRSGGDGPVVTLVNPRSANPTFIPTDTGTYVFTVTVSDGVTDADASVAITAVNQPPVADAGTAQTANLGAVVTLTAAASLDPDGPRTLSYSWSRAGGDGPPVPLSNPTAATASFATTSAGTYIFRVTVSDGIASASSIASVTVVNRPPTVTVGPGRVVSIGQFVSLTGSASDPDGDPIVYSWTRTGGTGPTVTLNAPQASAPSFMVPAAGTYVFTLRASDGRGEVTDASVTFTGNTTPVVSAGTDRVVMVNTPVTLAGSANDADGDPLSYTWSRIGGTGGPVTLTGTASASTSFTPAWAGTYIFSILVTDGRGGTAACPITVIANTTPTAAAGPTRVAAVGATVRLTGTGSDADGNSLTFLWTRTGGTGPGVTLDGAATPTPTFVVPAAGTYVFSLTVDDGRGGTAYSSVTIQGDSPPIADAGSSQTVTAGTAVLLDATASTDPDAVPSPLTYAWHRNGGTGPEVALINATSARPSFFAMVPGTYTFTATVSDGLATADAFVTVTAICGSTNLAGLTYLQTNTQGYREYRNEKDGSTLVMIPRGTFAMSSRNGQAVVLSCFFIGKYEVTNAQYRAFLAAADGAENHSAHPDDPPGGVSHVPMYGMDSASYLQSSNGESNPVIYVNWYDAAAYCAWAGLRQPTESEWEYAASGPGALTYPWGNDAPTDGSVYRANSYWWASGATTPVGTFGPGASEPRVDGSSPFGLLDMAGNVWEFCRDWFVDFPGARPSPLVDPQGPATGTARVYRGGGFRSGSELACSWRTYGDPAIRNESIGFRVAR